MAAIICMLACLIVAAPFYVAALGDWRVGRATFYGTDAWSIHEGSCHFGYMWEDEPLGWDITALSDTHYNYIGSCGRCYEVQCNPSTFKDGFGSELDRDDVCYNANASIVVRVTDTCPCVYPGNSYSNKRWCCGDMDHLDMSVWAFEKLADKRWGVIGVRYRPVPCDFKPQVVAPPPSQPCLGENPPAGAKKVNRGYNWQTSLSDRLTVQGGSSSSHNIYLNGLGDGWEAQSDANSTLQLENEVGIKGGANAACGFLRTSGSYVQFETSRAGPFVLASDLEFWAYLEPPYNISPAVNVQLASSQGLTNCQKLHLDDISPVAPDVNSQYNGWSRYVVSMANFQDTCVPAEDINATFIGCTGTPVDKLTGVRFSNALGGNQSVCLDGIRILSNAVGRNP